MRILFIDGDQDLMNLFSTAFKKDGFETVCACDGQAGLEKAKTEKPDFILLGQILPDVKGNDMLKTLKEDSATKSIPVAMLSNFGQNELVKEAIDCGALDYIVKYKVEPEDLINRVKELLKTPHS